MLAVDDAGYGVYFDSGEPGTVDVVAGLAVHRQASVPDGLVQREARPGTYAAFECDMASIGRTWGAIYKKLLPEAGYQEDSPRPPSERFGPRCQAGSEPVHIFVSASKCQIAGFRYWFY